MAHIYTNKTTGVSLYEDIHNATTPYIIQVNNKTVCRCDYIADAYREYNRIIREIIA